MSETRPVKKPTCGVIMPISAIDGCSAEHWIEVLSIITDAAKECDFDVNLVSEAKEVGIIQKAIVQNIYASDVVVCDVSGKNPNVMLELGMRLAFDKPVIVIKDSKTDYSFDTSPIQHLSYPRDLRFSSIVTFKEALGKKLKASIEGSNTNSFLKSFGSFHTISLEATEVPVNQYLVEAINDLKTEVRDLRATYRRSTTRTKTTWRESPIQRELDRYLDLSGDSRRRWASHLIDKSSGGVLDALQEAMMNAGKFADAEEFILQRAEQEAHAQKSAQKDA